VVRTRAKGHSTGDNGPMRLHDYAPPPALLQWLIDSDPAIRWQVMRDLVGEAPSTIAAERSRVASEGWGARLLDLQGLDGNWGDGISKPKWHSNLYTLLLLRDMGLDSMSEQARRAVGLLRDRVTWGPELPFFEGEVEPCINGGVLAVGAYFGEASERLLDRLLSEQLEDGGWNCEAPKSRRSSSTPPSASSTDYWNTREPTVPPRRLPKPGPEDRSTS
jgi:hypothetical protein